MEKDLDPVINFCAWDLVHNVGNHSRGEFLITTFVSKITQLKSYFLDDNKSTRVFVVKTDDLDEYYITEKTYDLIKERMHKGTPIKIEEVICVERV